MDDCSLNENGLNASTKNKLAIWIGLVQYTAAKMHGSEIKDQFKYSDTEVGTTKVHALPKEIFTKSKLQKALIIRTRK